MTFFYVRNAAFFILLIFVILFYLSRLRQQKQDVSTMFLWKQSLERRTPWRRWQRGVSLLMQLGLLTALVLTAMLPVWTSVRAAAKNYVLIIDTSASMQAEDVEPTRFDAAMADARLRIERLGSFERMAIVSADHGVRVHCGLTGDPKRLIAALREIELNDRPTALLPAVELARRLLKNERNGSIVIVSDGCVSPAERDSIVGEDVAWSLHGGAASNSGITRMELRPSPLETNRHQVLVEAVAFSDSAVTVDLQVGMQGGSSQTRSLNLPPREPVQTVIDLDLTQGGLATARLANPDGLAADNEASVLVPARATGKVYLVSDDQPALTRLLQSIPRLELEAGDALPTDRAAQAIVCFVGRVPATLPAGPILVIGPASSCDLWTCGEELIPCTGLEQGDSELLVGLDLASVAVDELYPIEFVATRSASVSLKTSTGEPVLATIDRPAGRILIINMPLDKSDLSRRAEFAPLIARSLRWLSPATDEIRRPLKTGSFADLTPIRRAGVSLAEDNTAIAASLLDLHESDIRPAINESSNPPDSPWSSLWMWLAAICLLALLAESVLYHIGATI